MEIEEIVQAQREFFLTHKTLEYNFRIDSLRKLKLAIEKNQDKIIDALKKDLGKSGFESYMCEIGMTLSEISYMIKNLKRFMRKKKVSTPLVHFPAKSYRLPCPLGVTLIMSPWNYPFMLAMEPLVNSLAAGNTVIIKPGSYAASTSKIIKEIIDFVFEPNYVAVVEGGRDVNQKLLDQKFDYIFFTGSKSVGEFVLEKAAKNLTPVTLELGGKSPCIVDKTANIKLAARRIVFGKYLNCGQTCVAPDYLLVEECVKDELVRNILNEIRLQFGTDPLAENSAYGKIINEKHFERLKNLIKNEKVLIGGTFDDKNRIAPTVLDDVHVNSSVMQEEIFGPILPILTFKTLDHVENIISLNPTPLALYLFSTDKSTIKYITNAIGFGGGCINDTIVHLASSKMPFGGVGSSGMGSYHGFKGFETFSHFKSILKKSNVIDLPVRYQPYTKKKEKIVKMFMK